MNDQDVTAQSKDNDATTSDEGVSSDRRAALAKIAYGSPAIAALLLSKSAEAQTSPTCGPMAPRFSPPCPP